MDAKSEAKLVDVHPDLVRVMRTALQTPQQFQVVYGIRTIAEEREAVATGHSTTMHSRHLPSTNSKYKGLSCAVDVAAIIDGKLSFAPGHEAAVFTQIANQVKRAASSLLVPIHWGGDWVKFKDWGHFELPWAAYN